MQKPTRQCGMAPRVAASSDRGGCVPRIPVRRRRAKAPAIVPAPLKGAFVLGNHGTPT